MGCVTAHLVGGVDFSPTFFSLRVTDSSYNFEALYFCAFEKMTSILVLKSVIVSDQKIPRLSFRTELTVQDTWDESSQEAVEQKHKGNQWGDIGINTTEKKKTSSSFSSPYSAPKLTSLASSFIFLFSLSAKLVNLGAEFDEEKVDNTFRNATISRVQTKKAQNLHYGSIRWRAKIFQNFLRLKKVGAKKGFLCWAQKIDKFWRKIQSC